MKILAPHGTWRRRRQGCRCDDCRKAYSLRETARQAGQLEHCRKVSPEFARGQIERLRARGWTLMRIASEAGVSTRTVWQIQKGKFPSIWPITEQRILRVDPVELREAA